MKKLLALSLFALLGGLVILPTPIRAQEEVKKEKKMRIKTMKVVDGKEVATDTTIWITDDMDSEDLEKLGIIEHDGDITVDVFVDSDGKHKTKKVIIMKGGEVHVSGDEHDAYIFHSDDGDGISVIKWIDEDGKEMKFDIDVDMESVMDELEDMHENLEIELKVLDGERIIMMTELSDVGDELKNIEFEVLTELGDLSELHELGEHNIRLMHVPSAPHYPEFYFHGGHGSKVSDVELRDAGIKNKPDRLDAEEIEIEIEDGVVDFYFKLKVEGNPKVIVYNVYGDKVFSDRPELMNGKFSMRMDLSQKQHGTYYLQVVLGNSSFTEKLRL